MHVVQGYHHALWFRQHWKLDGIVGGGAVFAITYSILNAVRNKTLNSRVLSILRERATPTTEQEISNSAVNWTMQENARESLGYSTGKASAADRFTVWSGTD